MSNIFVISDTHFSHSNILKFTDKKGNPIRPGFDNVDHMNETIIDNWNRVVTPQDKIYHLGDVYFGSQQKAEEVLSRLNGKKRLIVGNHDCIYGKGNPLQKYFQKVYMWRLFKEFNMVLTHVPLHRDSFRKVAYNTHGHIHEKSPYEEGYINVSCEKVKYTPVPIEEVIKRYKNQWQQKS